MYRRFGSEVTVVERGPADSPVKTKTFPKTSKQFSKARYQIV